MAYIFAAKANTQAASALKRSSVVSSDRSLIETATFFIFEVEAYLKIFYHPHIRHFARLILNKVYRYY